MLKKFRLLQNIGKNVLDSCYRDKLFSASHCIPNISSSAPSSVVLVQQMASFATKKRTPSRKTFTMESGDITTEVNLNPDETFFLYKDLKELNEAPDVVKRLCSIELSDRMQKKLHLLNSVQDKIIHACGMDTKKELSIVRLTFEIRNMMEHMKKNTNDKRNKSVLVEKIQMRKKLLKNLRKEDYEVFMWLLKELQIKYVPAKKYCNPESKRAAAIRVAREAAIAFKRQKIQDLRKKLEQEKAEFEAQKASILAEIEKDIGEFSLNKTDIENAVFEMRKEKYSAKKKNLDLK